MRIAVTGATGFVGGHLATALAESGHEVVAISRGRRGRARGEGITWVRADVVEGSGLEVAFPGCDAVIHLVAVIHERGRQSYDAVNRKGTENVVAAARAAGVAHLILQSALGASSDPRHAYLLSKWQGEEAVRAGGVPWTILRPSLIFGPGDGFFTLLARLARRSPGIVPVVGSGATLFQPISIEDVVHCHQIALERGPSRRIHEIGGPEHLSYREMLRIVEDAVGARRINLSVPAPMVLPGAFVMSKLFRNPPLTPAQMRMLELNNITALDSTQRQFGVEPAALSAGSAYLQHY